MSLYFSWVKQLFHCFSSNRPRTAYIRNIWSLVKILLLGVYRPKAVGECVFTNKHIRWYLHPLKFGKHWTTWWWWRATRPRSLTFTCLDKQKSGCSSMTDFLIFEIKITVIFNWNIIALQCCIDSCHISAWISHRYTYVLSLLNLLPTSYPLPPL